MVTSAEALTKSQAARRQRVLVAALQLGADGGYDAVQMRDIAATAEVALGTIYRYFPSKDALLAAAMVEWMEDLERRVTTRAPRATPPPSASTTCCAARSPRWSASPSWPRRSSPPSPPTTARRAGRPSPPPTSCSACMLRAFPDDTDPETEAAIAKVLGHVWFSCLVAWSNGVGDLTWVSEELETASHLLCDHLG